MAAKQIRQTTLDWTQFNKQALHCKPFATSCFRAIRESSHYGRDSDDPTTVISGTIHNAKGRTTFQACITNVQLTRSSSVAEAARCFVSLNISLSHSWSFKLIENGTIRKPGYGFLRAFHSNYAVSLAVSTQ